MARICLTCSNTGIGTLSHADGTEHKFACLQCAEVQRQPIAGVAITPRSQVRDVPRYTLRRQMGDRWLDVLHTGATDALDTKAHELYAKGCTPALLSIIDNWA